MEFEFLERKPKEATKKLILVRSVGMWDTAWTLLLLQLASALFWFLFAFVGHDMHSLQVLFFASSADLSHGLSSFVCLFWFPPVKCEV